MELCQNCEDWKKAYLSANKRAGRLESALRHPVLNTKIITALAEELVAANSDRGRSFDNSPSVLETEAMIYRHLLQAPISPDYVEQLKQSCQQLADENEQENNS